MRLTSKQTLDKQRTSRRIFKHQRKRLQLVHRAKGKTKEIAEGLTNSSGIITDLSSLEDEIANLLGNIQPKDAEAALDISSLPDPEPSMPTENPLSDKEMFFFDLETSSRSRDCEIVQLAAVCKKSSFDKYVIPNKSIASNSTTVHGINHRL